MRYRFTHAIVLAAILTPAVAQISIAQTSTKSTNLEPLAFLAGSCWKGTFTGRAVTDEHCFTWIYNGRFLRDHHVVVGNRDPYEGETTYAWDAGLKQIVYWYIALPGFHSHGNVEPSDGALVFHDNLRTADAKQLSTTWTRNGNDAYTVRVEELSDGKSKELWSMVMRRSRSAPD
jgi:hypothetical protein